jgi:hypothetical protein
MEFLSRMIKLTIFFSYLFGQGSWSGLVPTYVVSHGPSDDPRSRSRPLTDAIYLAPDPDLGPDPSPGSAVCRSGCFVNLRRQNFNFKIDFYLYTGLRSGSRLPGLPPSSWASHVLRMRCPYDSDQSGKVRIRVRDSDPVTRQLYFDAPKQN